MFQRMPRMLLGLGVALMLPVFATGQSATSVQQGSQSSVVVTSSSSGGSLACAEIRTVVNGQEYVTQKCTMAEGLICMVVIGPSGVTQGCYSTP